MNLGARAAAGEGSMAKDLNLKVNVRRHAFTPSPHYVSTSLVRYKNSQWRKKTETKQPQLQDLPNKIFMAGHVFLGVSMNY